MLARHTKGELPSAGGQVGGPRGVAFPGRLGAAQVAVRPSAGGSTRPAT